MSVVFSIFFDGQFWVGVLEVRDGRTVRAARHVFGPEPTDAELADFCSGPRADLLLDRAHAAPTVPADRQAVAAINPKRLARQAAREARRPTSSTRAQESLRLSREAALVERKVVARRRTREQDEERYRQRRARQKERHRGR